MVSLTAGCLLPHDRAFAVTNGNPISHARLNEGWLPKRHFLQLLNEARLAGLSFHFDEAEKTISLYQADDLLVCTAYDNRAQLTEALYALMPDSFIERPIMCQLSKAGYTDTAAAWITIGGTASIEAFAELTQTTPDSRRFRLNLIIHTDTAFEENQWAGQIIQIGDSQLEIVEPVGRCGAISVNPDNAVREGDYLPDMETRWGHTHLGMFARVCTSGDICVGQKITCIGP